MQFYRNFSANVSVICFELRGTKTLNLHLHVQNRNQLMCKQLFYHDFIVIDKSEKRFLF